MKETTGKEGSTRISPAMLDEMLEGLDPSEAFHSGELIGELRQRLAERILNAEMDAHLDRESQDGRGNSRNGHNRKTVLTDSGSMGLAVPRDRQGTFEPQLVERYCRRLPGFDAKVISMFAHGMSTRHIQRTVAELYAVEVSPELIAKVTDAVLEEYESWQSRPLSERYPIVYLDAIQVKVRDAGVVTNRAVHLGIGIREDGCKEVLGLWLGEKEGARYWLTVLNELKNRGVQDILIAVVDGLKGFSDALETAFPEVTVQTCVVHLLRHSLSRASHRERKALAEVLKGIYQAASESDAEAALDAFEDSALGERYPDVVRSWREAWSRVVPFFAFSEPIRKAIYTTNAIESLNSVIRRAVKQRGHFTSPRAARKLIYLALREVSDKWQNPGVYWDAAKREFAIHFADRFEASTGYVIRARDPK